jgi:perosamine synthetase
MNKVVSFARKHNLFLIEDAAQSLGSTFSGKHLGTFGDVGSLSFSAPKIITTGQGGALLTNHQDLFQKILLIKDFGRPTSGIDYHEIMGFNGKFSDWNRTDEKARLESKSKKRDIQNVYGLVEKSGRFGVY